MVKKGQHLVSYYKNGKWHPPDVIGPTQVFLYFHDKRWGKLRARKFFEELQKARAELEKEGFNVGPGHLFL